MSMNGPCKIGNYSAVACTEILVYILSEDILVVSYYAVNVRR